MTDNPGVGVNCELRNREALVVERTAVRVLHNTVVALSGLVAELIISEFRLHATLNALSQFLYNIRAADRMRVADGLSIRAESEHARGDLPGSENVAKSAPIVGLGGHSKLLSFHRFKR